MYTPDEYIFKEKIFAASGLRRDKHRTISSPINYIFFADIIRYILLILRKRNVSKIYIVVIVSSSQFIIKVVNTHNAPLLLSRNSITRNFIWQVAFEN